MKVDQYKEGDIFHVFYGGPFSNWFECDFVVNCDGQDLKFNCSEQYIMHKKAMFFEDYESAAKIMESKKPYEQKELGRNVKKFNQEVWDKHKFQIVFEGCYQKFSQNPELRSLIVNTPGRFVEASPTDLVWGIGWDEFDPNCFLPHKWRGENLLGKVLDDVRTVIQFEMKRKCYELTEILIQDKKIKCCKCGLMKHIVSFSHSEIFGNHDEITCETCRWGQANES